MNIIKITNTSWERGEEKLLSLSLSLELNNEKMNIKYSNEKDIKRLLKSKFFVGYDLKQLLNNFMKEYKFNEKIFLKTLITKEKIDKILIQKS